ncbi:hypothetical protein MCAN360_0195 [Metamycoplasma canadense]|uniref:Uncharacterized protein n=1 Tax=Metamycoplasma canadense TaxID=29554 RepID=A0A077L6J2_9BACT|nr:hypothetical protein MCAN360_0195 [Metamycoplasma canadense]
MLLCAEWIVTTLSSYSLASSVFSAFSSFSFSSVALVLAASIFCLNSVYFSKLASVCKPCFASLITFSNSVLIWANLSPSNDFRSSVASFSKVSYCFLASSVFSAFSSFSFSSVALVLAASIFCLNSVYFSKLASVCKPCFASLITFSNSVLIWANLSPSNDFRSSVASFSKVSYCFLASSVFSAFSSFSFSSVALVLAASIFCLNSVYFSKLASVCKPCFASLITFSNSVLIWANLSPSNDFRSSVASFSKVSYCFLASSVFSLEIVGFWGETIDSSPKGFSLLPWDFCSSLFICFSKSTIFLAASFKSFCKSFLFFSFCDIEEIKVSILVFNALYSFFIFSSSSFSFGVVSFLLSQAADIIGNVVKGAKKPKVNKNFFSFFIYINLPFIFLNFISL